MKQEPGSEKVLVERVREGDRQAFAALIRPQSQRLIAMANRMLGASAQAEECVQDALASVWVARARLDPQRPFTPFVTTVVLNKCRDRHPRHPAVASSLPLKRAGSKNHSFHGSIL